MRIKLQPDPGDEDIIFHLQRQQYKWTKVLLEDGTEVRFRRSGWSYDLGEAIALVFPEECDPHDLDTAGGFHTSDVVEIIDEQSGRTFFSKN